MANDGYQKTSHLANDKHRSYIDFSNIIGPYGIQELGIICQTDLINLVVIHQSAHVYLSCSSVYYLPFRLPFLPLILHLLPIPHFQPPFYPYHGTSVPLSRSQEPQFLHTNNDMWVVGGSKAITNLIVNCS